MKQLMKKGMSLLLAFVLILGLVPAISLTADAATVEYRYSSKGYIYNWGTREEVATFLSPNAESFYTKNNVTLESLSDLSGSSDFSSLQSSALYTKLCTLMSNAHTYETSYDATRSLFQYTDCQGSARTNTAISCFYTGGNIGPSWDSGSTWNREHTWPNSKSSNLNNEDDIMMLRPTSSRVNSSRGNKAYGQSSGYYNPNVESNGKHNLHGDVARIVLYVYVRWGKENSSLHGNLWGSTGVFESKELLLDWMEEDPVDTWELGRNDSVESITGTRNVFVDFPELAFLLFDEQVPAMQTPSGSGGGQTPDTGITIDSQPVSLTVNEGKVANFTVAATGTKLTYQWQYRTSETDTWKNSPATGNKTATLSVPGTLSRNGYQYRCVITNGSGSSLYSDAATLTVKEEVLTGWVEEGGAWCYYVDGQKLINDWAMDSAGWYFMGADGYAVKNAWTKDSSGWYYMGADGRAVKDTWVMNEGGWMYIGSNKHPVTNDWAMDSAGWYFMGADGY
ncbi:MAG: endonuclease, partial [Oscillospiraceae bacterium]|nr:endonuclease [Oscillospiraceae bacterium]